MDDERRRVTVVGARRRVDIALPARAPIGEYLPLLTRLCGQETDETFPAGWSLAPDGAAPLWPDMSLSDAQVIDGAVLHLRDSLVGEAVGPLVTDVEQLASEMTERWDRWNARHRAMTTIGIGLGAFLVVLAALAVQVPDPGWSGLLATVVGFGFAFTAWIATRRRWAVPLPLRMAMALAVCPALGLAGYASPLAGDGTGAAAVAVGAGATVGALIAFVALPHETTLLVGMLVATSFLVAILLSLVHADLVESAAVAGVVALVILSLAPTTAMRLVALAPARSAVTDAAAEMAGNVNRGRRVLIAIALISSLAGAVSLLVLASSDRTFAIALAVCLSLAMIAQAGRSTAAVAVMSGSTAGAVGLVGLAIQTPVHVLHTTAQRSALITCGLAAVIVAVGFVLAVRPVKARDQRPFWWAMTGLALTALSVPLTLGVFGGF